MTRNKQDEHDGPYDQGKAPQLKPDLQKIYEQAGPERYARNTAKYFAKGGQYHPDTNRRRRYALT